jgi:hypothetical protein
MRHRRDACIAIADRCYYSTTVVSIASPLAPQQVKRVFCPIDQGCSTVLILVGATLLWVPGQGLLPGTPFAIFLPGLI